MGCEPFYAAGLRFSCTRCSTCCRKESGFVYLSEKDLSRLAEKFKMGYTEFIKTWCRWVPFYRRRDRLSLREKSNFDCIFWGDSEKSAASDEGGGREGGCTVYSARPLQCRSFPFWDSCVSGPEAWKNAGMGCPGINSGELHTREEIEGFIRMTEEEPVIEREMPHIGGE